MVGLGELVADKLGSRTVVLWVAQVAGVALACGSCALVCLLSRVHSILCCCLLIKCGRVPTHLLFLELLNLLTLTLKL